MTGRRIFIATDGIGTIEFAAVASLIAIAALTAFVGLGVELQGLYSDAFTQWEAAQKPTPVR